MPRGRWSELCPRSRLKYWKTYARLCSGWRGLACPGAFSSRTTRWRRRWRRLRWCRRPERQWQDVDFFVIVVVVVKWSVCSPYTAKIRARILLKITFFSVKCAFEKNENKQKRSRIKQGNRLASVSTGHFLQLTRQNTRRRLVQNKWFIHYQIPLQGGCAAVCLPLSLDVYGKI